MPELLQHILVTIVALGAVAVIVRRVAGVVGPGRSAPPKCANCPSQAAHAARAAASHTAATETKPLTLIR